MLTVSRGSICFWEGACMWVINSSVEDGSTLADIRFHAHHAVQVTRAIGGQFQLQTSTQAISGNVVAVAADAPHTISGHGLVAFLYIEPEGRVGRAISKRWLPANDLVSIVDPGLDPLRAHLAEAFSNPTGRHEKIRMIGRALVGLLGEGRDEFVEATDPRVAKLISWASCHLEEGVSLTSAPRLIGLSAARARHLFVEQTALAFRTYVLWLRLMRALELFSAGSTLTDAAHRAGFSDSAHLSRTFRRMFGIAAASMQTASVNSTHDGDGDERINSDEIGGFRCRGSRAAEFRSFRLRMQRLIVR